MPKTQKPKIERAQRLIDTLVKLSDDEGLRLRALQILDRMRLPMKEVLPKVPGLTVLDKAKRIGISRQTYYSWMRGASRPNTRQSKVLAELTGMDWKDINGRTRLTPPRPAASAPPASSI